MNGTSSSAVVKDDGSLQLLTVIEGPDAPDRFAYSLDIPEGATIDFLPDGGALVTKDGSLVLGIAAPWAVDGNGSAVPTTYELSGSTLTQVVDHRGKDVSYPIVADPWLGAAIFQQVYQNASLQYISAVPSQWGAAIQLGVAGGVAGWAAGQAILKSAGWDELRGKAPIANNKATYRQQYDCHVLGAYVPFTAGVAWDLEGTRSNNPYWINNAASHLCNWR
ncbi:hypothetical protein FBY40_3407 [Microbacterium sp. SLBN-154]|uniref:hypothetical protein n=1 Tax=Microbacterium sp. SLBN-154 TaxID=2768458 RepID=UPI00117044C6|nr:hypothetical protein [Microbacterium sp. SLBN-154]TQK20863.1 hypothetical protein FBY40_3407 [Microbacterium sp. SLBN-154]